MNPTGALLPEGADILDANVVSANTDHPLMSGVDFRSLQVQTAHRLKTVPWLEPLVESAEGPLLLAGELDGRRVAVLTFDPADSNLPTLAAFPLLMSDLVDWLDPLANSSALQPGIHAYLPPMSNVLLPDGSTSQVSKQGVFIQTDEQGVYQVSNAGSPDVIRTFAVNMANTRESGAAPLSHAELERSPENVTQRLTNQEYWSPLAAFALVLVGTEWIFLLLEARPLVNNIVLLHPELLWLAVLFIPLLILGARRLMALAPWRRRLALFLQVLTVLLLLVAVAQPAFAHADNDLSLVVVLDRSGSVTEKSMQDAVRFAQTVLASAKPTVHLHFVAAGAYAEEISAQSIISGDWALKDPATNPLASATDLAAGLRLAGGLLDNTSRRRVVVVTDGWETQGSAADEAANLGRARHRYPGGASRRAG